MLLEMHIKNFILIENLTISFQKGFNVMTGETGAGKSMIIGALALLLGEQVNRESIRLGSETAMVQGVFEYFNQLDAFFEANGIEKEDEVLIIQREWNSKGKSSCRINGQRVTLAQLKLLTPMLIHIHGQLDNQSLLYNSYQLEVLDRYAGEKAKEQRVILKNLYEALRDCERKLELLKDSDADRVQKMDFLSYQIEEIERANLKCGEDEALEDEFEILSRTEEISKDLYQLNAWLSGEFDQSVTAELAHFSKRLSAFSSKDRGLKNIGQQLTDIKFLMDDLSRDALSYMQQLENKPDRKIEVEQRLDTINGIKIKYGQSIEKIHEKLDDFKKEYDLLVTLEDQIQEVSCELEAMKHRYHEAADFMSSIRKEAAKTFEVSLENEIQSLNMKDVQFKVSFQKRDKPLQYGMDQIDFLISTNLGQPFGELKKVLSGGELSRMMLAIKVVLGDADQTPCMVFDEIDSGISGVTADVVGSKIATLSQMAQIICITHLPQVAVYADAHFMISKLNEDGLTKTDVKSLNEETIHQELIRLVSGEKASEATYHHVSLMREQAKAKVQ